MTRTEDPKGHAWATFLTAHAVLIEAVEAALAAAGLPPLAWYDVLWELEKAGEPGLRMHALARRTVITRPNLSRLADRLEDAGLIERRDSPADGRGYDLVITKSGRAKRKAMWPVYEAQIEKLFSRHVSVAEARALSDVLARAIRSVRKGLE